MKKIIITLSIIAGLVLVLVLSLKSIGLSPTDIGANIDVGKSMSAKLACSGYHLSGFDLEQNKKDIDSYTPISSVLGLEFKNNQTHANLLGSKQSATYRPGLGCTLDIGDTAALDELTIPPSPAILDAAWPKGQQAPHLQQRLQSLTDELLKSDNDAGLNTRALLVIKDGKLIAESYADYIDPDSQLLGWSMGKSITALLLGHLELRGKINAQTTQLFPQWSGVRQDVSLEHLLHMSSGLDFSEVYAPGSDATRMLFSSHSAASVALESNLAHPPGTHFYYSSGTTNLLMQYMTNLLGSPQAMIDYLYNSLLYPAGALDTTFEVDPSGVLVGSSYIYSSARDWARFGLVMINNGFINQHQIVSPGWITRATTPNKSTNDPRYGYQFWLNQGGDAPRWADLPADAFAMLGNRQQIVMMIPSHNAVIVRLGWTSGRYPTNQNIAKIVNRL